MAHGEASGTTVGAPEARKLAVRWAAQLDTLTDEMTRFLVERIGLLRDDPTGRDLTRASCASNLEAAISMIRHGIPAERTEAPVTALEHARWAAQLDTGIEVMLRFYRLGHRYAWERWSAELMAMLTDRERLASALDESGRFFFIYVDALSAGVNAAYLAERDRRARHAAAARSDAIQALLAGGPVDVARAERALGHALARPQLAFLCWTDGDGRTAPGTLEQAALAVADALGSGARPLLSAESADRIAGWVHPADRPRTQRAERALAKTLASAAPAVHVALGEPAAGAEGFRSSRDGAERALRAARMAARHAPTLTRYADVALVDLLSRDLPAARAFVAAELGELARPGELEAQLRATLLAWVRARGSYAAAAAALGVHRNTVLQRLRRAEELRGRGADERGAELHAALLLAAALG